MDAHDQIALRRDTMLRGLGRARSAVPQVAELDPALGDRLDARFKRLANEVEDGFRARPDVERAAELVKQGEDLVAETLAFLGGAAARAYGLDEGIAALALVWLDKLSSDATLAEVGVVIPASTEFTGMLTQVVRLRVPGDGIWGLPVAVHEYGHFVASVLSRRDDDGGIPSTTMPVEHLLHDAGADSELPQLYWHGHELFADGLAAAVTGPAYAEYCLRYRFDPAAPHALTATHPSPARRMRIQFMVLEALAEEDESAFLAGDVGDLRTRWTEHLAAAGHDTDVPADALLDPLERELLELLKTDSHLRSIRYDRHVDARMLAESGLDRPHEDLSVAHVLNAAWYTRRDMERTNRDAAKRDQQLERLAQKATALVEEVLARG